MTEQMIGELTPAQLRAVCPPDQIAVATSREIAIQPGIVGQPRATAALSFGLGMGEPGYNIVVAGPPGTGKMTALKTYLDEEARSRAPALDVCYVENFRDPEHPSALLLPAGRACQLAGDLTTLIQTARQQLPRAFESDEYTRRAEALQQAFGTEREERFGELAQHARARDFGLQVTPMGVALVPLARGEPMTQEQFAALKPGEREALQQRRVALDDEVSQTLKLLRDRERAVRAQIEQLDRDVALHAIGGLVDDLIERYADLAAVAEHLAAVREDMIARVDLFRAPSEEQPNPASPLADPAQMREQALRRYKVNVIVDRSGATGAPVVVETFPTYQNLIGRVEKEPQFGMLLTDFTLIRAGALHRANGGYLVVEATDLLTQPLAWEALKRALRTGQISIDEATDWMGFSAVRTLRPTPVPLNVKVVLTGESALFDLLLAADPSFAELFRVRADFDWTMPRTPENEGAFLGFVARVCADNHLAPFDRGALALLVEHASRLAEDQSRLSVQFGAIGDVIHQAAYWAARANAPSVGAEHVRQALDAAVYRSGLVEERLREMMSRGTLLVDTDGAAVGQVNGLAVATVGDHSFGHPTRITATVGVGREGILDVERAARLGGPLHSKGVLILAGFLTEHFARNQPLALAARLTFEQSYGGVDGDSASSTELYALLSSLAEAPIKQGLAVTGSVNQKGQIQAIGGVNEKIEGFFALCKARGLTGAQGVLIPASNVPHLMLREEIVEAVRAGQFHVYPVATVAEGITLLTGVRSGAEAAPGSYPPDSIYARVEARLHKMADAVSEHAPGPGQSAPNGSAGEVPVRTKLDGA